MIQQALTTGSLTNNIKNFSTIRTGGVALALLAASLAAPVAQAGWVQSSNTYTYTSSNYGLIFDGENLKGEYTNSQFQTWSMTFANPLGANYESVNDVGAISWTFDDGRADGNGTFDSTTGWQYISVGTNGSGTITDWLAGFAGPAITGGAAIGFSCGGLGCDAFRGADPSFASVSELGYSWLLSEASVQFFDGQTDGDWNTNFSSSDGQVPIAAGAIIIGAGQLAGGLGDYDPAENDVAYYGLGGSVPEPGALALVCAGLMGTFAARRRAQRQA
jgi:hypothetical protein